MKIKVSFFIFWYQIMLKVVLKSLPPNSCYFNRKLHVFKPPSLVKTFFSSSSCSCRLGWGGGGGEDLRGGRATLPERTFYNLRTTCAIQIKFCPTEQTH